MNQEGRTWSSRQVFLLTLTSVLLLQASWILALPAFRGIDEFDHVYKAEAVAHGQLFPQAATKAGRGGRVIVPEGVVAAASAMCASYDYTKRDNCHPVEKLGNGMVTVASGAASYNPAYYAVVGAAARPFTGAAADFALRAFTAILAALLLAWAAVVTAGWARNAWPFLALAISATPMLVYSTAIASPNGVEYAAACLLWAAGLSLVEKKDGPPPVGALVTSALVVVATHSTGAMWLALVLAVVAVLQPGRDWLAMWRRWRRTALRAAVVVCAGGAACVAWILMANTNSLSPETLHQAPLGLGEAGLFQALWALQTIAVFPLRNEAAPSVVYLLWLVPFLTLMVLGVRRGASRLRLALGMLLTMWVVVPAALSYVAFSSEGMAWQGRYALPLAVGFPALAGLALSRSGRAPQRAVIITAVVLMASAQAISTTVVAWKETHTDLSPTFAVTVPGGVVVVAALAVASGVLLLFLLLRAGGQAVPGPRDPVRHPVAAGSLS